MWLGRDDYGPGDWPSVRAQAVDAHNEHTAEYLTGEPLLADVWPQVLILSACPVPTLRAGICKRRSFCEAFQGLTRINESGH
jgi:hypothetical protein